MSDWFPLFKKISLYSKYTFTIFYVILFFLIFYGYMTTGGRVVPHSIAWLFYFPWIFMYALCAYYTYSIGVFEYTFGNMLTLAVLQTVCFLEQFWLLLKIPLKSDWNSLLLVLGPLFLVVDGILIVWLYWDYDPIDAPNEFEGPYSEMQNFEESKQGLKFGDIEDDDDDDEIDKDKNQKKLKKTKLFEETKDQIDDDDEDSD